MFYVWSGPRHEAQDSATEAQHHQDRVPRQECTPGRRQHRPRHHLQGDSTDGQGCWC